MLALNTPGPNELHRAALAGNALARSYAEVVRTLLQCSGVSASAVQAIGAHGQTVRHRPQEFDGTGYTLQLNNPSLLAEHTAIAVVADFRSRDVAAGGQGAPLVPAFHQGVFGRAGETVLVLNIGGISNLSVLGADGSVQGFDCGPGNALMDHWCQLHTGQAYDCGGAWAAQGQVLPNLLATLMQEPFLHQPPPKSTGRDLFSLDWLQPRLATHPGLAAADVQRTLLALTVRAASGELVPVRELVTAEPGTVDQPRWRKDGLPLAMVVGDMAGQTDSPLYAMFGMRGAISALTAPDGGPVAEYFIRQPDDAWRGYAIKWDGEWQITYETFRDMGAAYAVGLILIYLLVVAQFGSYLTPLIIMAPIPLTIIGVMPGHALFGSQFTATSMIGMIALAGIIVRNSILLVDFIKQQVATGMDFAEAVIQSAAVRAKPIALTGLAAMLGALFILDDPIFNGLAISLIFGIFVSTVLTLVVIPVLYYAAFSKENAS